MIGQAGDFARLVLVYPLAPRTLNLRFGMIISSNNMLQGIPLFPLPDFFLFPGAVAPLHIFEPRYRQMISDLLDSSGRFVLALYRMSPNGR